MSSLTPSVSPLRQRMIDDMRMRKFNGKTQIYYIRAVRRLAAYLKRSPDTATAEDLRSFQLHMVETGTAPPTINATLSGLKFFFDVTLGHAELLVKVQPVHQPRPIPVVLSCDEVARLIAAAPNAKYQAALSVAYGAGLRASEVCALKVTDIDSERMTLRVEQGKGRKDGEHWITCRRGFFLPVRVLSRLFRRRFLEALQQAHRDGRLQFFGEHAPPADTQAFTQWLAPLHQCEWVVYAKRPFAGPEAVLAYLSRYTHRVAISNSRLIALDERGVTFRWKDYRDKGRTRHKTMTLAAGEFMRRFLLHVLPAGFHRIRHYGLLATGNRTACLALARQLLHVPLPDPQESTPGEESQNPERPIFVCPHCGHAMTIVLTLARGETIRAPPLQATP